MSNSENYEGGTYTLAENPAFDVDVAACQTAARKVREHGVSVDSGMEKVIAEWGLVRQAYNEPSTNATVDRAMESLKNPAQSIENAMVAAAKALETFADTAQNLRARHAELEKTRAAVQREISTALREHAVENAKTLAGVFNREVASLQRQWTEGCQDAECSAREAQKKLGLAMFKDVPAAREKMAYPDPQWGKFKSDLGKSFKTGAGVDDVARYLAGMTEAQRRQWLKKYPEVAQALEGRKIEDARFPEGSQERKIQDLVSGAKKENNYNVDGIGEAWAKLSAQRRSFLLMAFPAVFGNMNGIPFADRVKANKVSVIGARINVEAQLAEKKRRLEELVKSGSYTGGQAVVKTPQVLALRADIDDAQRALAGLRLAEDQNLNLLVVSGAGDGRFAVIRGNINESTTKVAVSIPGTTTDGSSLQRGIDRIDAMIFETNAVGIYWQGTDLPDGGESSQDPMPVQMFKTSIDNATDAYNAVGAPRLAAFDAALDRELGGREQIGAGSGGKVRTVYVAHSAGASMLGTAEAFGLDSTAEVYVAAAGKGSPFPMLLEGGRGNEEATRYRLQAPNDPIKWAQGLGWRYHGGGTRSSSPLHFKTASSLEFVGANPEKATPPTPFKFKTIDLEPGYKEHENGGPLIQDDHNGYFGEKTTSIRNIQGVISGDKILPRQIGEKGEEILETRPEEYRGEKNDKHWKFVQGLEEEYRQGGGEK